MALEDVQTAQEDIKTAQEDIEKAQEDMQKAQEAVKRAQEDVKKAQEGVQKLEGVKTAQEDMEKAQEDMKKAQEAVQEAQTQQKEQLLRVVEMKSRRMPPISEEIIREFAGSIVKDVLRESVNRIAEKKSSALAVADMVWAVCRGKRMRFLVGLVETWDKWTIIREAAERVIKQNLAD